MTRKIQLSSAAKQGAAHDAHHELTCQGRYSLSYEAKQGVAHDAHLSLHDKEDTASALKPNRVLPMMPTITAAVHMTAPR